MRSRSAFGLLAAFGVSSFASSALAQLPPLPQIDIPGLTPPAQPVQPVQPAPAQPNPGIQPMPGVQPAPYGQPAPYQPVTPGFQQPQPGYAQPYSPAPGYGQPYAPAPGYGQPNAYNPQGGVAPYAAPKAKKKRNRSTPLEIAYLYTTAAAYGVGAGIWIDAEAGISDPGVNFIMPALLGVAAPVGVYFLDSPPLPKGMPSAIATGMIIGGAEGLGFSSYQYVSADAADTWSFRAIARSEMIGATLGGAAGWGYYYLARPKPQRNMLFASAAVWGAAVGTQLGAGGSTGDWGQANDATSRGGLIGMNVFLAGSLALGHAWTPSWNQLGWMWGGFGIGEAVSAPVYLFYAGGDHDPRHGLIFQGVAGTLGVAAGAFIGRPDRRGRVAELDEEQREHDYWEKDHHKVRILGGGLMPVQGGMGLNATGQLW